MKLFVNTFLIFAFMMTFAVAAQAQQTIKGTVQDSDGNPLIGVSVSVNGKAAAITDINGQFSLKSVDSSTKLLLSYVGYKNKTISVGKKSSLLIVMEDDNTALEELVVVGYSTIRKQDLTGAVASVGTEKLNEKGAVAVLENLQGSVPGVSITKNSGRTDGSFNIEIRGKNSINGSQTPLYVVDGVICSDIDFLNPQDIERIDVLKDASSTAIYGSRATAGVVMVTTKSGTTVSKKQSKPTIAYDMYYGISNAAHMPDFLDADEFYRYRFMKFLSYAGGNANNGQPMMVNQDIDRCLLLDRNTGIYRMKELLSNGKTYNWPDFVLQKGHQQNHYVSVSGSGEKHHYHIGLGYANEKGTYKGDEQRKYNIKGSLDVDVNSWLTAGFNVNLARIDRDYASDDAVRYAFRINPFMQPYDKDGNINYKPGGKTALNTDEYQFTDQLSPLIYMEDESKNKLSWIALGNVYLNFKIFKDLQFKTTFSPNFSYNRTGYYRGTKAGETQNTANRLTSQGFSWTWDNMLTYDHTFNNNHHLNVMGLFSANASQSESESLYYNKVLEGTYWWNLGTSDGGYNYSSGTGYGENSLLSYALRANYSYKGKYMATATIRWDGSSRFADGNRWGSFPSLALAWRLSEENFMQKTHNWLSNLKFRVSYGVTGNNNVSNYATMLTVGGPTYYPLGTSYQQGMYPSGIVDKNLKWEKSNEINLGIDFGFFNERIRGSVDWYNKKSNDLLYSVQLPLESGGTSVMTNIGSVRNRGIEVALTTENIDTKDWHWTTSLTFAHNDNEVLEVNGKGNLYTGSSTGNLIIGEPYNNIYGYEWVGIVSDKDMIVPDTKIAKEKGFTPGTTVKECNYYYKCYGLIEGNPIIDDKNGDGKFTDDDKRIYKSDPDWTGSFTSNLQYKSFDFSFSIYSKQNYTVFSNFYQEYLYLGDRGRTKIDVDWYIPAGTLIDCDGINADGSYINPKYQETTHYGNYPFPNYGATNDGLGTENWLGKTNSYTDASYVKVKHITLGYTLPRIWLNKIKCQNLRVYCTVTNPFIFTNYKGYDPEWAGTDLYNDGPSVVTWQFGANIKF